MGNCWRFGIGLKLIDSSQICFMYKFVDLIFKRQECECERHTCGGNCDRCCPMYNQVLWQPGTSSKGFQCEKCNCNNHANACRYDFDIASQYLSMDTRGKFRGGGVCIDCTVMFTSEIINISKLSELFSHHSYYLFLGSYNRN